MKSHYQISQKSVSGRHVDACGKNGWIDRWMGYMSDTISVEGCTFIAIWCCWQQNILWPSCEILNILSPDFKQIL